MPAYYDEKTKTWYVKRCYTDYTGTKHQRKKRGSKLQQEAKEWERAFLETQQADLTMTFENFVKIYEEDMFPRLRYNTVKEKRYIIDGKLLPFFGKIPLSEITPAHVRKWQNEISAYRDDNGQGYAATYLKVMNNQLSAIMNYAVKYYDLKDNPCRKAGSMGKSHAEEMSFWTLDEFKKFLEKVSDKPRSRAGFLTLYYTGLRIGELLALEYADIDFEGCKLTVNKSIQHIGGKDIVTPPKTAESVRTNPYRNSCGTSLKRTQRSSTSHAHMTVSFRVNHITSLMKWSEARKTGK